MRKESDKITGNEMLIAMSPFIFFIVFATIAIITDDRPKTKKAKIENTSDTIKLNGKKYKIIEIK
jgi:hypothetical protein